MIYAVPLVPALFLSAVGLAALVAGSRLLAAGAGMTVGRTDHGPGPVRVQAVGLALILAAGLCAYQACAQVAEWARGSTPTQPQEAAR